MSQAETPVLNRIEQELRAAEASGDRQALSSILRRCREIRLRNQERMTRVKELQARNPGVGDNAVDANKIANMADVSLHASRMGLAAAARLTSDGR